MPLHPTRQQSAFSVSPAPGLELHGEAAGQGPPIVLLHGLTATRRNVVQGSRHLLSRGRTLIGYDARGHGESSSPADDAAYDYADLTADLAAVIEALDLDGAVVAGSSMGAATAVRFALASPRSVVALVLITPAYRGAGQLGAEELAHWDRLADALDAADLDGFVEESGANALPERWREPVGVATRQRLERHRDLGAVARALRVVPRSEAFADLRELEGLDVPALVVGSRDGPDPGHPLATAEEYASRLPRAELVVEDEGDAPLGWRGAQLSRTIGDYLESVHA